MKQKPKNGKIFYSLIKTNGHETRFLIHNYRFFKNPEGMI